MANGLPQKNVSSDEVGSKRDAKDFLLEEYKSFSSSLLENEKTGETRVNWFIGIVTAAVGGLVKLISGENSARGPTLRFIVVACLMALLVFGIITLLRMIQRNKVTDRLIYELDLIRQIFRERLNGDNVLSNHFPFERKPRLRSAEAPTVPPRPRNLGGLRDLVLAINSVLFAGLFAAIAFPGRSKIFSVCQLACTCAVASCAFGVAFAVQYRYVRK